MNCQNHRPLHLTWSFKTDHLTETEMDLTFSSLTKPWWGANLQLPDTWTRPRWRWHSICLGTRSTNPDNGSKRKNRILDANYETTDLEEKVNRCKYSYRKGDKFKYKTALNLSMGHYHIPLDEHSQKLGTTILPWENFNIRSYQWKLTQHLIPSEKW